jgi:polysaccharide biosynthesis/export protein
MKCSISVACFVSIALAVYYHRRRRQSPGLATFVRLSRDGVTVTISLNRLVSDPAENICAWPGDVLTLVEIPQTFSMFGATGQNTQQDFNAGKKTLALAVARADLQDQRADPSGAFCSATNRPLSPARSALATSSASDPNSPVVYGLDFRDPNSYFLAYRFQVEDKDITYVSTALLSDLQKKSSRC